MSFSVGFSDKYNVLLEFSAFLILSKLGVYYEAISMLEIHDNKFSMEMT